jgi:hypothetical protein
MAATLTPKFDRLVAKYRTAGHNVVVENQKMNKGAIATARREATVNGRGLATVTVYGTVECLTRNTSFKITDR